MGKDTGYLDVPLSNDNYKIFSLYNKYEKIIGTGPKLISQLSSGLSSLTNYKLKNDNGHMFDVINSNIKTTKLPSLSLRSSKNLTADGIEWHYRTIIGTKTIATNTKVTLGKLTLLNFTNHDNYYVMHDNGTDGNPYDYFFEKATKIYQFWSAHVEKK